jgi:hypothetical protein
MDLVSRAKNILLSPKSEWQVIAGETTTIGELYSGYIVILAALPPLCALIGFALFLGRVGVGFGFIGAALQYGLSLGGVYVVAVIARWLAPQFGGRDDFIQALKLVAYAHTASWVGGIVNLLPFLGIISLLMSLYGLYLLYIGAGPVMGVPAERAVTYTLALIITVIVVFALIGFIVSTLLGIGMMGIM